MRQRRTLLLVGGVLALLCALVAGPTVRATADQGPVDLTGAANPRPAAPATPTPSPGGTVGAEVPDAPTGPALGASAVESLLRLYDVVKVTAGYVAAARLEPGGGSGPPGGDSGWKPPADLQVPPMSPAPMAPPTRTSTKYDVLGAAYQKAADALSRSCHLSSALLMAIGEVESSSLRGRKLDARHDVVPPVIGPALSGGRFAAISDSDGGRLDGDPVWDRAVGPMQFIPGTWRIWGADGNGDGVADPQNVEDAALAAGRYLCAGGRDLSRAADLEAAVLSYNHSSRYLATVLDLYDSVMSGLVAGP